MPDSDHMTDEQNRQEKCTCHLDVLRREEHFSAIQTICEDTTKQRKNYDRKLAKKQVQTEIEGIFGQIIDQPTLGELLNERADGGRTGANPHDTKVTIAKRSEKASEGRKKGAH